MSAFLFGAAAFVVCSVALGLFRVLWGPDPADRLMAAQLAGSGGGAALMLLAAALQAPPIVDVALMLAILATLASVGFVNKASDPDARSLEGAEK